MKLAKSLICAISILATQTLQAVIINTPDGGSITFHETVPASGAPWNNVLNVNGSSGVYIGNGWVLTAKHVYSGAGVATVIHEGTTYGVDTSLTLDFSDGSISPAEVDLRLFRLNTIIPGLSTLSIGSVTSADAITMIGRGGGTKRWGTNEVEDIDLLIGIGDPATRHITSFYSDYDTATTGEAQAIGGDSGGGVFHNDGSGWKIAGIMIAVGSIDGSQVTVNAQLDEYQSEIEAHIIANSPAPIPEPSSGMLLALSGVGLAMRRSR